MSRGTQARLPATLPDPAQALATLRLAREVAREKRKVVQGLREHSAAAKDEAAAALLEVEAAEADLLATVKGSPEHLAAQDRHGKAWKRLGRARTDIDKLKATRKVARNDEREAEGRLLAAREDLEALRQGRRPS